MAHKGIERRKHPRIQKSLPVKIADANYDIITETENISCSGAYCKVDRFIPVLTKLKITLLIPTAFKNRKKDCAVVCSGVVVRSEKSPDVSNSNYKIAIFFNKIKNVDAQVITNFVTWHLKGANN